MRGLALVWMAIFHFCFDLSHFGLIEADFYRDPLWTVQRTCILSLFLLCAGAGQAVATAQRQTWQRFWRRWAQVAGCALLVSVATYFMFGPRFIYFGVLHGMAVMLIVARLSAPLGKWLWPLGAVALALPWLFQHPLFDSPWLNWTGLVTHKPATEDHVPLLPWLGVMWWGMGLTQWLLRQGPAWLQGRSHSDDNSGKGRRPGLSLTGALAGLGRWSLSFYMLHQPVLMGALLAWMWLSGRPLP